MDEMRVGICPQCKANDVYLNVKAHRNNAKVSLAWFSSIELAQYICCTCGYIEEYVKLEKHRNKVRRKCVKVEPPAVEG